MYSEILCVSIKMPQIQFVSFSGGIFCYCHFLCLKTVFSGDPPVYTEQRLSLIAFHCTVSWWFFEGQIWQMSLEYHCREAPRSQLGFQAGMTANTACALAHWVPRCTVRMDAPPPAPGLCCQVSPPACGASLDHCHLQHVLPVAYHLCLFKMSTRSAPAKAGPRVTQLCTSGRTVKLWVCQPGNRWHWVCRMNHCSSNDMIHF